MGEHQPNIDLVDELHVTDEVTDALDNQRFGFFPDAELVIALVCPLGTDPQAASASASRPTWHPHPPSTSPSLDETAMSLRRRLAQALSKPLGAICSKVLGRLRRTPAS